MLSLLSMRCVRWRMDAMELWFFWKNLTVRRFDLPSFESHGNKRALPHTKWRQRRVSSRHCQLSKNNFLRTCKNMLPGRERIRKTWEKDLASEIPQLYFRASLWFIVYNFKCVRKKSFHCLMSSKEMRKVRRWSPCIVLLPTVLKRSILDLEANPLQYLKGHQHLADVHLPCVPDSIPRPRVSSATWLRLVLLPQPNARIVQQHEMIVSD